jgi:hypothetical protein
VDLLLEKEGGVVAGGHPLMVLRCLEGGGVPKSCSSPMVVQQEQEEEEEETVQRG